MVMDLKGRILLFSLALTLWVLVAKVFVAPGRPAAGENGQAGFVGEPDFVQEVMNDVADIVGRHFLGKTLDCS